MGEQLKLIGYSEKVHLSIFCSPYGGVNAFRVVAEILKWFTNRVEPGVVFPGGTTSEAERVLFIRTVSQFLINKTGIKINPRKLYTSSFGAAKELFKLSQLLLNASQTDEDEEIGVSSENIDLRDKVTGLPTIRT